MKLVCRFIVYYNTKTRHSHVSEDIKKTSKEENIIYITPTDYA